MHLVINGENKSLLSPLVVAGLLESMAVDSRKVAVEVNGVIIPKSSYTSHSLQQNDVIEIVGFIGGG